MARESLRSRSREGSYVGLAVPPTSRVVRARSFRNSRSAVSNCARSSSACSRFNAGAPGGSMATERLWFSTSSGIGRSAIAPSVGEHVFDRQALGTART